jgi:hypothetical protein
LGQNVSSEVDGAMKLSLTITVTEADTVSILTKAEDMAEAQIRPAMDKAIRALTAEREAIDACPYHQKAKPHVP